MEANVGGNYYDKHATRNPIARMLMNGFYAAFDELTSGSPGQSAFEVGCGEGYLMLRLHDRGWRVSGMDLDRRIVGKANETFLELRRDMVAKVGSIYVLPPGSLKDYDLVVCCEVLEHLPDPLAGLAAIKASGARRIVLSVPREPIWRILNVARGKYVTRLGNTPGHLNHWSSQEFVRCISNYFDVKAVRRPIPWTFVHAEP
jgi:2-polyprenyl-3-methyl-5-hydroxy-6-metoxy-1,4-benzoquinol methylase